MGEVLPQGNPPKAYGTAPNPVRLLAHEKALESMSASASQRNENDADG